VAPEVSVLVPAKDEAENLPELVRQARDALLPLPYACELVIVNDGSLDGTAEVLRDLSARYPFLRVVSHRTQRGIADALRSGAEVARGNVFVFFPADLQYLPADIPGLVAPIFAGEADLVTGAKQGHYDRRFVSAVYNQLCRWLFGIRVTDLKSVKAYRREVVDAVPARPDWHRFFLVIAVGVYALIERFAFQHGNRACLYLVLLLIIGGLALFVVGFLGEMVATMQEEVRALQRELEQLRRRPGPPTDR